MSRWFPHPILTVNLIILWLLLAQSISPGQLLLGALVGFAASHGMAALRPDRLRIGSVGAIFRLAGMVTKDVIESNIAVIGIILFGKKGVSNFVSFRLEMTNVYGLAVLAFIITATPGTMWVQYDRATGELLVHVLDLKDEEEWVRLIRTRYEKLLMEIFP